MIPQRYYLLHPFSEGTFTGARDFASSPFITNRFIWIPLNQRTCRNKSLCMLGTLIERDVEIKKSLYWRELDISGGNPRDKNNR